MVYDMKRKFFVKIVSDPEVDLRKSIVGIACAAQAVQDGYDVHMFFAANGVKMLNADFIERINQSGMLPNGKIVELMQVVTGGAKDVY